ncbi:MAG: hypothetical protein AB1938_14745 [Myxococcota bacterium]
MSASDASWRRPTHHRTMLVLALIVLGVNLPLVHFYLLRGPPKVTAQVPWQDDFSDPKRLAENYWSSGGLWRVEGGALVSPGVKNNPLWLQASVPRDFVLEVDATPLGAEADVRLELCGDGVNGGSGYTLAHGAFNNAQSTLGRLGITGTLHLNDRLAEARRRGLSVATLEDLARQGAFRAGMGVRIDAPAPKVEPGRTYHHRVERIGAELRWSIDGQEVARFVDPFPLEGRFNDRVGLNGWEASIRFDSLKIFPATGFAAPTPPPLPPAEPFADDFERSALGDGYRGLAVSNVALVDGRLRVSDMRNRPVWLTRALPDRARVSFRARSLSPEGDIKVELWGDGQSGYQGDPRLQYTATGYVFILGGWRNTISAIARQHEHTPDRVERSDFRVEPERWYQWTIERQGGNLLWKIDGRPFLEMNDGHPLTGPGNRYLGFSGWQTTVEFDELRIEPL